MLGALAIGHIGLVVLVLLGRGFTLSPRGPAAEVERAPVDPDARTFVNCLAVLPAATIGLAALFTGRPENFLAPALVVLTALAVVVLAPDRIRIVHQRLTQYTWAMLLLLPPLIVVIAVLLLPWIFAVDLRVAQPAAEMGRFFAEIFERRTGRPLAIVTGDTHTAALVALNAPSRPSLEFFAMPALSPWVTPQNIAAKGAVVAGPLPIREGCRHRRSSSDFRIGRGGAARVRAPLSGAAAARANRLGCDPAVGCAGALA